MVEFWMISDTTIPENPHINEDLKRVDVCIKQGFLVFFLIPLEFFWTENNEHKERSPWKMLVSLDGSDCEPIRWWQNSPHWLRRPKGWWRALQAATRVVHWRWAPTESSVACSPQMLHLKFGLFEHLTLWSCPKVKRGSSVFCGSPYIQWFLSDSDLPEAESSECRMTDDGMLLLLMPSLFL